MTRTAASDGATTVEASTPSRPGRKPGSSNRNYPPLPLEKAATMASALEHQASGTEVSKLTLAELVNLSPSSSNLTNLILASRAYGLTSGGKNGDRFAVSDLGSQVASSDPTVSLQARRAAIWNIGPFRQFLEEFNGKKIPSQPVLREFLVNSAKVAPDRVGDAVEHLLADCRYAGVIRSVKSGEYIDLDHGVGRPNGSDVTNEGSGDGDEGYLDNDVSGGHVLSAPPPSPAPVDGSSKKVFIAHGKNRRPLEQLKQILDKFKVSMPLQWMNLTAGVQSLPK